MVLHPEYCKTRYHLKELSERNLILARVVQFCLLKGAFGNFCFISLTSLYAEAKVRNNDN